MLILWYINRLIYWLWNILINWYIGILIFCYIDISNIGNVCFSFAKCVFSIFSQATFWFVIGFLCILCIPRRRLGQLAGPGWAAWEGWASEAVLEHPRSKKRWKPLQKWPGSFRNSMFSNTFWTSWTPNKHFWPGNASGTSLRAAASGTTTYISFPRQDP